MVLAVGQLSGLSYRRDKFTAVPLGFAITFSSIFMRASHPSIRTSASVVSLCWPL